MEVIDAREEAADRFSAGQSVAEIAAEYGLTVRTIHRWLIEDGLLVDTLSGSDGPPAVDSKCQRRPVLNVSSKPLAVSSSRLRWYSDVASSSDRSR